jgi:pimeloyl-ACP methyl ester carboxylesterase
LATKTILFIHGLFMTPLCWEKWIQRFKTKGYHCVAPAYEFHEGTPAALRNKQPNAALARLTLDDVVARYADAIHQLAEPPLLIGHSMGGLITQILLSKGLGVGGVAVDSAPPRGVFAVSLSFLRANFPLINPFVSANTSVLMSRPQFNYAFVNRLSPDEQKDTYNRYVVPESRRVGRGPLTRAGRVEYDKVQTPLLLIAGGADHIVPSAFNHANFRKYGGARNVAFKEFEGRGHWIIAEHGWKEVADYAYDWIQEQGL